MTRFIYIIICALFVSFNASAQKPKKSKKQVPVQKEIPKRYELRSGELLLFSEMDGMRTKITVAFDNHGAREVTESVGYRMVEQDLNLKVHSKSIVMNGVLTTLDLGNLVMRSETMTNGVKMRTYAVKIEANKPLDESMLIIPEDIVFKKPGE
ncbi:MAG: hypothetical protein LW818_06920 [Ignavibacteriae bacterium]|nr:hypothetical protein [Ignavibacteriota bacterium]